MRVAVTIELTAKERLKLESLTKGRSSSLRARERAAKFYWPPMVLITRKLRQGLARTR